VTSLSGRACRQIARKVLQRRNEPAHMVIGRDPWRYAISTDLDLCAVPRFRQRPLHPVPAPGPRVELENARCTPAASRMDDPGCSGDGPSLGCHISRMSSLATAWTSTAPWFLGAPRRLPCDRARSPPTALVRAHLCSRERGAGRARVRRLRERSHGPDRDARRARGSPRCGDRRSVQGVAEHRAARARSEAFSCGSGACTPRSPTPP
jgi:hypothetical protein